MPQEKCLGGVLSVVAFQFFYRTCEIGHLQVSWRKWRCAEEYSGKSQTFLLQTSSLFLLYLVQERFSKPLGISAYRTYTYLLKLLQVNMMRKVIGSLRRRVHRSHLCQTRTLIGIEKKLLFSLSDFNHRTTVFSNSTCDMNI